MQRQLIVYFVFILVLIFLLYPHRWRWHLTLYSALGIIVYFSFSKIQELIYLLRPSIAYTNPFAYHLNLDRLYLLEKGWDIVKNNPFLGIGPGGFELLKVGLFMPEVSSHNIFLEVAIESGVLASILFTIILLIPITKFILSFLNGKYRSYDNELRPWVISLLGFYVILLFSTCWNWGFGAALFCILGVVVYTMKEVDGRKQE